MSTEGITYLDPEIANDGFHAEKWTPPSWADDVGAGEEWQPDIEPPRINDYAAFKKHKHYGKYFRPYRYVPFPAWMHHATKESVLCQSKDDVAKLGPEWTREPQRRVIDMTGKALPIKTDTQRLAEAITLGLADKTAPAAVGAIDPNMIAAIVAAVIAATQKTADPVPPAPAVEAAPEPEIEPETAAASPSIERLAMIELAEKEGIKIDKRWGDNRLRKELGL